MKIFCIISGLILFFTGLIWQIVSQVQKFGFSHDNITIWNWSMIPLIIGIVLLVCGGAELTKK